MGARVRLQPQSAVETTTTVVRATPDSLLVADNAWPWRALERVEVRGRQHGLKAALVGGGIGLVVGAVVGTVAVKQATADCERQHQDFCGLDAIAFVPITLVVTLVGSGIGVAVGTERWTPVWPVEPSRP